MLILASVTLLWAFSFSLIGTYLSGSVDASFAVLVRITLALLVFGPLMRLRGLGGGLAAALMAVGAVELGLMYIFFYQSYFWLSVPEVLLFTIFMPIYITLLEDALRGRFDGRCLIAALGAVAGAAVIRYQPVTVDYWRGVLWVQAANLCFAAGQVGYRRVAESLPADIPRYRLFGWFFAGAWILSLVLFVTLGDTTKIQPSPMQWGVLLWLGLGASGLGFYAWNHAATKVNAGTLAVMNNMLIPAGLIVNLVFWNRDADLLRLIGGGAVIVVSLALSQRWIARRSSRRAAPAART